MSAPERGHREHLSDELLIELALEPSDDAPDRPRATLLSRELARCAICAARLENWRAFLDSVRVRAQEPRVDPERARALADRILASTTRQPARERRVFAAPIRAAAAAVLFAALALGVAWRSGLLGGGGDGAGASVDLASVVPRADSAGETAAAPSAVEQERSSLASFDVPARADGARTPVGHMLQARGEWLGTRAPIQVGDESAEATLSRALAWDGAVRALCCEHLLDRYLMEGSVPEGLDHAMAVLLEARTPSGAERRLELAALSRAREYGLLDPAQSEDLDRALARAGVDARGEPLFSGGPRTGAPIDVAWLGALEAALDGRERGDPVVSAWLAMVH